MFECIKNWFNGPDINDCNIEVKIKYVNKKHQTGPYFSLASYSVEAFWRIEGAWLWRSAGVFHDSGYGNRITDVKPTEVEKYLNWARSKVKNHLNGVSNDAMRCKFHVSELDASNNTIHGYRPSYLIPPRVGSGALAPPRPSHNRCQR